MEPPAHVDRASGADQQAHKRWAVCIHGGAGVIAKTVDPRPYVANLERILKHVSDLLEQGTPAMDAVQQAVEMLEDCELFNAGKGASLTTQSTFELEASIMDGTTCSGTAVTGVTDVKNPIRLARAMYGVSPHRFLGFHGAKQFADRVQEASRIERVDQTYYFTERRYQQLLEAKKKDVIAIDHSLLRPEPQSRPGALAPPSPQPSPDSSLSHPPSSASSASASPVSVLAQQDDGKQESPSFLEGAKGTVGAVAVDVFGHLAAATSTGGLTNKWAGRIGDTPINGAGNYANQHCAVSCTGNGEQFMRYLIAHDICLRMELAHEQPARPEQGRHPLQESVEKALSKLQPGDGGVIAVSRDGATCMMFNSLGMFRGAADSEGLFRVAVWE